MGDFTQQLSEMLALVSVTDPNEFGTGTNGGDVVDMRYFRRVMFIVAIGALGTAATVDFKLQGSADGSTGWTDITGKAITQLTEAGTDANKQAIVEITAEETSTLGYRYVRGLLTVGGVDAGNYATVIALGGVARYEPVAEFDLDSVDEIVT
jgi:hypothetical protein